MPLPNPLTEEHEQCLDACLENCRSLREAIQDNEAAGIPMADRLREVEQQEELARKIKARKCPLRS